MPLGVFAIVPSEDAEMEVVVQLAVSKEGTLAGTYINGPANISLPLDGSVDKQTQRAAWKVGEEDAVVMETQLASFTKDQSTILLHFEGGVTESWWMFRIDEETAQQIQEAVGAKEARGKLLDAYDLLQQSLNDQWRSYLGLPSDIPSGSDPPSVNQLRKSLSRFDRVAGDPAFERVAELPGFSETHVALREIVEELEGEGI
jgi:hypothetical protein